MTLPDVIAGVVWAVVALLFARRGGSTAAFAGAVALTWVTADLLSVASLWHRFALIVLLVCAPRWLPRTWAARGILCVELIAAVAIVPWTTPLGAVVLSAGFVTAAIVDRAARSAPRWAAVGLAAIAFATPVLVPPGRISVDAIDWGYAGCMVIVGLLVLGDLGATEASSQRLDLLVELESAAASSLPHDHEAADRLQAKHEQLLRELEADVAELHASRRRLAEARLTAARELREDLEARVIAPLTALATRPVGASAAAAHLSTAREHVRIAREDIEAITRGLGPRSLANGVGSGLRELCASSPIPVALTLTEGALLVEDEVAVRTAYLLCAEALANATKHSRATGIRVELHASATELLVEVTDDGVGGADPDKGTGLASIRDRVEAVSGSVTIRSDRTGTAVSARIPAHQDHPYRLASSAGEVVPR